MIWCTGSCDTRQRRIQKCSGMTHSTYSLQYMLQAFRENGDRACVEWETGGECTRVSCVDDMTLRVLYATAEPH